MDIYDNPRLMADILEAACKTAEQEGKFSQEISLDLLRSAAAMLKLIVSDEP